MNLQFFSRSFLFVFHLISIASWHFPEITLFTSTSLSKCHDVTKRSSVVSFLRCSLASISTLVLCSYLTNSLARFGLSLSFVSLQIVFRAFMFSATSPRTSPPSSCTSAPFGYFPAEFALYAISPLPKIGSS